MKTESYEIVIPEKARVMTEDEMEYEGGFLNFIVSAVCTVVSVGCDYMAKKTGSSAWAAAAAVTGTIGLVTGLGVGAAVAVSASSLKVATKVASTGCVKALTKVGTAYGSLTVEEAAILGRCMSPGHRFFGRNLFCDKKRMDLINNGIILRRKESHCWDDFHICMCNCVISN